MRCSEATITSEQIEALIGQWLEDSPATVAAYIKKISRVGFRGLFSVNTRTICPLCDCICTGTPTVDQGGEEEWIISLMENNK